MLEKLKGLMECQRPDVLTLDFATLYTIPHDMLKNSIRTLVRGAYKVGGAKYLVVHRFNKASIPKAHWSKAPSSVITCMNVSKSKLIDWMEYLIGNIYIKVGNKVHRQTIGIPMGTDCAPQLADLFLFHYVNKGVDG